jgi:hypothetical protein
MEAGASLFYRRGRGAEGTGRWVVVMVLQRGGAWARARDGAASSGDHRGGPGAAGGGRERAGDVGVLVVPWRRSSTMTTATGLGRGNGGVLGAEAEVKARTEATGRARALQSSWAWP